MYQTVKPGASLKQQFLSYWRLHTNSFPIREARGVVDSRGMLGESDQGFNVRKCIFTINDYKAEKFPFKMNSVDHFILIMPELKTLENCPVDAMLSAQYGSVTMPMRHMDNLKGTVFRTKSLSVVTEIPIINLENKLVEEVQDMTVIAPEILSFEGLNENIVIQSLTLDVRKQKTFKGIHKQIKSNVKMLSIGVGEGFEGGLLPIAMLDPVIQISPNVAGNPPVGFTKAMDIIIDSRLEHVNVHEIQERIIDAGLGKYAQL